MKINLENMKGLAEKLDVAKPPTLEEVGITKDDICNMAYQIQYFFEAMEYISCRCDFWKDAHFKDDRARWEAYKDSLLTLKKTLIHKEEPA